jgi:zinc protease
MRDVRNAICCLLVSLLATVFGFTGTVQAAGQVPATEEAKVIEKYTLGNGMTVVIRENQSSPVVAVQVWVKAGSTTEPETRAGMSHILEHMAFKGTHKRTPGQIAREVEALGGEINAYTSFDQTVYHITISGRYLDNAMDILADTLGDSLFDEGELKRELEVILEEVRMNEDDPGRVGSKALFRAAYRVHPYGRPVIGYPDTIKATTREDLVAYFRKFYVPSNMVLVVTGGIDAKASRPAIEKIFGALPAAPAPKVDRPAEPPQDEIRIKSQERDARRAYVDLGFHGPAIADDDVYAWDLLSIILGGGQTSRLYHEVKDKRQLVDSVSAYSYTPRDAGLLMVGATAAPDKAAEAYREILRQTFRMAFEPPQGPELARAKNGTESDFLYSLESQGSLARHVGFFETALGDANFQEQYLRKIRAVTADDILRVGGKYLSPDKLTVSTVLPKGDGGNLSEEVIRKIATEVWDETAAERAASAKKKPSGAVRKVVLENGVRVIVRENHSVPVISVEAGFLGGLRAENSAQGGVSAVMAELLTKGTPSRNAREIAVAVEDMAGDLSGFAGRNSFGLRAKFIRRDFEKGFELFRESLLSPTFPADELEKKRKEVLGRLKLQKDELTQSVFLLFLATHYGEHPYSRNPLGTEETIKALTPETIRGYYERWADPRNLVLAFSGDLSADEAVEMARKAFGSLAPRAGFAPLGPLPVPKADGIRKAEEQRNKEQAHFVIGYPGLTFTDAERYPLDVLGSALAGMGGRLFTNLRDKKSLAYSVTSFSSEQVDPGFFAFYMGTSSDKLDGAIADTLKEIAEVREGGVTQEEFDRAKKWMIGNYEIGLQSNGAYADRMMYNELYGIGYEETFRSPELIQAVTLEQVNAMARKVLSTDRYTIAVIKGK